MFILSGRYKGLRIKTKSKGPYRPTSARVRKSLFEILGDLKGLSVLDLFAGSGILGFESASRGAEKITFVERDNSALDGLKINALQFKDIQVTAIKSDVFKFLENNLKFDLIFADPPYVMPGISPLISSCLDFLSVGGRFVLESSSKVFHIPPSRIKKYGDTQISIWKK
ncbi:MAG: RsmD family RNA methyltransferase [Candidatus Neomarinimicrobiota bacterium]